MASLALVIMAIQGPVPMCTILSTGPGGRALGLSPLAGDVEQRGVLMLTLMPLLKLILAISDLGTLATGMLATDTVFLASDGDTVFQALDIARTVGSHIQTDLLRD